MFQNGLAYWNSCHKLRSLLLKPHGLAAQNGPQDEDVAQEADNDDGGVDGDQGVDHGLAQLRALVQILFERSQDVFQVAQVCQTLKITF